MATVAVALPKTRRRLRSQPAGGRACFTDIYFVKRIDNSRLRREMDPEKRRECFCLLGLVVLVFLLGLHVAWQAFQSVRDGYQIEAVKAERAALEEWNHQLCLERASLADPQRVDTLARRQLGLAPPAARQVILLPGPKGTELEGHSAEFARNLPPEGKSFGEP
jgi:cell division protein FtsL